MTVETHPHEVQRLTIAVGAGFDDVRAAPLQPRRRLLTAPSITSYIWT